jgi:hypothetical protein
MADFIASLPYAAKRLRVLFCFGRFERGTLAVWSRWIRPENVITSSRREKRVRRCRIRPERFELKNNFTEKKFLWNFFLGEDSCAVAAVRYPT